MVTVLNTIEIVVDAWVEIADDAGNGVFEAEGGT